MLEKKVSRICRNVIFAGVMLLSGVVCVNADRATLLEPRGATYSGQTITLGLQKISDAGSDDGLFDRTTDIRLHFAFDMLDGETRTSMLNKLLGDDLPVRPRASRIEEVEAEATAVLTFARERVLGESESFDTEKLDKMLPQDDTQKYRSLLTRVDLPVDVSKVKTEIFDVNKFERLKLVTCIVKDTDELEIKSVPAQSTEQS